MVLLSSACLDSGNGGCSCRPDLHQLPLRQLFRFERIEALTPMSFTHRWQIELFSLSRCPIQASRGLCGPRLTREGSLLAAPQSSALQSVAFLQETCALCRELLELAASGSVIAAERRLHRFAPSSLLGPAEGSQHVTIIYATMHICL